MLQEVKELQIHNRGLTVIFGYHDSDLSLSTVLQSLSKFLAVVDPGMVSKFKVEAGDPDHISLFFTPATSLESTFNAEIYPKLINHLLEESSKFTFEAMTLGSLASAHEEESKQNSEEGKDE